LSYFSTTLPTPHLSALFCFFYLFFQSCLLIFQLGPVFTYLSAHPCTMYISLTNSLSVLSCQTLLFSTLFCICLIFPLFILCLLPHRSTFRSLLSLLPAVLCLPKPFVCCITLTPFIIFPLSYSLSAFLYDLLSALSLYLPTQTFCLLYRTYPIYSSFRPGWCCFVCSTHMHFFSFAFSYRYELPFHYSFIHYFLPSFPLCSLCLSRTTCLPC
jgi:hypothetical protein